MTFDLHYFRAIVQERMTVSLLAEPRGRRVMCLFLLSLSYWIDGVYFMDTS